MSNPTIIANLIKKFKKIIVTEVRKRSNDFIKARFDFYGEHYGITQKHSLESFISNLYTIFDEHIFVKNAVEKKLKNINWLPKINTAYLK